MKEKERLTNQKLLLQLEKEMKKLELSIKHPKLINAKSETIKGLKIGATTIQAITPYLLTVSILTGVYWITKTPPFDDKWNKWYISKNIEGYTPITPTLTYFRDWEKDENNVYCRTIDTYSIEKFSKEDIDKIFEEEKLDLESILGKPIKTREQKSENTTEEYSYITVRIDKSGYTIYKEKDPDSIDAHIYTFIYILYCIAFQTLPMYYREMISSFKFRESINIIKEQQQQSGIEALKKKLEIKKENYNRLTR